MPLGTGPSGASARDVNLSVTVLADASGNAILQFNGPRSGYIDIDSIAILVTGSSVVPVCTVYDGPTATPGRVRASSRQGDKNTFVGNADRLYSGAQLTLQWTGCTPSVSSCNAIMRGVEYP